MFKLSSLALLAIFFEFTSALPAQSTLSLASGVVTSGGTAALNLSVSSPVGGEPVALQWTFADSTANIRTLTAQAGASATSAAKSLSCSKAAAGYTCLLYGMNSKTIPNGVVAIVNLELLNSAVSTPVSISGTVASDAAGGSVLVAGTGGNITASGTAPVSITAITCNPTSLGPNSNANCTVALSAAASAAADLSLVSSSSNLIAPASLTIPINAVSATFTVSTRATAANETATITAKLGASSASTSVTLTAPKLLSAVQCNPSTLTQNASTSCTVTLSQAAASGGATVSLASSTSGLTVPATIVVPAGSTTGVFTAMAGGVTAVQTATVTASYGGSTSSTVLTLTPESNTTAQFLLHGTPAEIGNGGNGATITPASAPAGLTGVVVSRSGGSVNFAAGSGVYFLKCCANDQQAYYKFTGSSIGPLFDITQGEVSFNLTSRMSFAQRQAAGSYRTVFHVRDGSNTDRFVFFTQGGPGLLRFGYMVAGTSLYYIAPAGTEDQLFGNGVTLKVRIKWANGVSQLFLNGALVQSSPFTATTPNWSSNSIFNIGAYEYLTFGGYNVSDDAIGEFSVSASTASSGTTPAPTPGGTTSGSTTPPSGGDSTGATMLQIRGVSTEVAGTSAGAVVTPTVAPAGFTGKVVSTGGAVNFASAGGVYFLNCCISSGNAYYKFGGAAVGTIFDTSGGQISFSLTSRSSFTARQTTSYRTVFDVRDNDVNNHLFYFLTSAVSNRLIFSYRVGGDTQFYYVPSGTEDGVFGNGVTAKVTIMWDGLTSKLYVNDVLVQTGSYTKAVPNWTAASNFDFGAYEYGPYGGYNASDDVIRDFTVSH